MKINKEHAIAFWAHMMPKYNAFRKPINKRAQNVLDTILDNEYIHLPKFKAITLPPFVFTSEPIDSMDPEKAVRLCVHECVHLRQGSRWSIDFYTNYVRHKDRRANYEIEAYTASFQMRALFGKPLTAGQKKQYAERICRSYCMPEMTDYMTQGFLRAESFEGNHKCVQQWIDWSSENGL